MGRKALGGSVLCWRRGATLVVVLGALFLVAILATVFATLTRMERSISRNYVDQVRAKLIAQTGVDYAINRLYETVQRGWFYQGTFDQSWIYYGNQNDETKDPAVTWRIESATNPSFAHEDESPQDPYNSKTAPKLLNVNLVGPGGESIKQVGFSGAVSTGTYGRNSDQFTLKILDTSSQININDGAPWGPGHSVSKNVQRMLNHLGKLPEVNVEAEIGGALGDKIIAARPPGGYINENDLLRVLNYNIGVLRKIRDYICVHGWRDNAVANPVPLSAQVAPAYPISYLRPSAAGMPLYRYGYNVDFWGKPVSGPLDFGKSIYDQRCLNPQWIEIVERAPVNVNTAPPAVLKVVLADLQGWFVLDKRRNNPYAATATDGYGEYLWWNQKYTYRNGTSCGLAGHGMHDGAIANGEASLGVLTRTKRYYLPSSPGAPAAGDLNAQVIADELVACRRRANCMTVHSANGTPLPPTHPATGIDYAVKSFGGPFKSWAQFHRFVDELVRVGVIRDPYPDPAQERIASQAFADVLKANFNPNLHLNETNPDKQLFLLVDKTDLIQNSTEFCFVPTGMFEIESLGRILRPVGGDDALTAPSNEIVAEKKIYAVVRIYDQYRETNQRQFYRGLFAERTSGPETNNNYAVETGPEPDNGPAPAENEYSGYVSLASYLGNYTTIGTYKPKGALVETPQGGKHLNATIHAHFATDFTAHYHEDIGTHPIADASKFWRQPVGCLRKGFKLSGESWSYEWLQQNAADKTEGNRLAPYAPVSELWFDGTSTGRYRICRSFRVPASLNPSPPPGFSYSPTSLRIDGAYIEHGTVFGYKVYSTYRYSQAINLPTSFDFAQGGFCFWFKPNWFPWCTGKVRVLADLSRFHRYNLAGSTYYAYESIFPNHRATFSPFTLYFFPAHQNPAGTVAPYDEPYVPTSFGSQMRPSSLGMAVMLNYRSGYNWEMKNYPLSLGGNPDPAFNASWSCYSVTPTLNHEFHGPNESTWGTERLVGADDKLNLLRDHEWTHVGVVWHGMEPGKVPNPNTLTIFVNGFPLLDAANFSDTLGSEGLSTRPLWHVHSIQVSSPSFPGSAAWLMNAIRLGGDFIFPLMPLNWDGGTVSNLDNDMSTFSRAHSADGTFDEFYFWATAAGAATGLKTIMRWGRYYRSDDKSVWTSNTAGFSTATLILNGQPFAFTTGSIPGLADGMFASHAIDLSGGSSQLQKSLPPPCSISSPSGTTDTSVAVSPAPRKPRLLGVSWTAYAEYYIGDLFEPDGKKRLRPVFADWYPVHLHGGKPPGPPGGGSDKDGVDDDDDDDDDEDDDKGPPGKDNVLKKLGMEVPKSSNLQGDKDNYNPGSAVYGANTSAASTVDVYVVADGKVYGPYRNEAFAPVKGTHLVGNLPTSYGEPIELDDPKQVRYMIKFRIGSKGLNTILMATPILDDITLYFDRGGAEFINYGEVSVVYGL